MRVILVIFAVTASSFALKNAYAEELTSLQYSAAIDITAPMHFSSYEENKMGVRSAEFTILGPIDSSFGAKLNIATHLEEDEYIAELHEAYIESNEIIPNSKLRVGKFFLGIGQLNQLHRHDWAFISAPRVHSDFFSEVAVIDTGIELSTALPLASYWDITIGLTNGYHFGDHAHDASEKPRVPTHYIHPVNYVDLAGAGDLQWGSTYLGRTDTEGHQTQLYGFDLIFKKMEGNSLNFLFQSEIWYRNESGPEEDFQEQLGAYFYPQISLSEKLFLGLRVDLFTELNRVSTVDNSKQGNLDYALVPTLTYQHSEGTLLRAAYTYNNQTLAGEADQINQKIEFQWVAILGSHASHAHH